MSPEASTYTPADRQEFRRVEERPVTPRSNGWKERKTALPFLQPSQSQDRAMEDAVAHRRERITVTNTIRVREGFFRIGIKDEIQTEHHPIPVLTPGLRNFVNYLSERLNQGEVEAISTAPRETETGEKLPSQLTELFRLAANETIATQIVLFSHDLPDRSRSYSQSVQTPTELTSLIDQVLQSAQGPSATFDNPALRDVSAHLFQDQELNQSWQVCRANESPEALSKLVVATKDGEADDESAYTALYPGEVVLLHRADDQIDAMIRLQKNEIDPELEVAYTQPSADLEQATDTAVVQAMRIMIDKEACMNGRRLPIIQRHFAELNRLQDSQDIYEILESLEQHWGATFAPFINRIRAQAEKDDNKESKRRSIDNSRWPARLVRQTITRDIPALNVLLEAKATLLERVQQELKRVQLILEFEALESLDQGTIEREIKCRKAQELLELCGMSPVMVRSAKDILLPFMKIFTSESDQLQTTELRNPGSLEQQLSLLVQGTAKVLHDATERRGSSSVLSQDQIARAMAYLRENPGVPLSEIPQEILLDPEEQAGPEPLTLTEFERAIASLKLRVATITSDLDITRTTYVANGEKQELPVLTGKLSTSKTALRREVDDFCRDWNYLLGLDAALAAAYDKLPLMPDELLTTAVSQMIMMAESRIRAVRENAMNFQHDLAFKLREHPLARTLFGGYELMNGDQPSATLRLLDGLIERGYADNLGENLQQSAQTSLVASLLNNEPPIQ
jgi:hypothetical protein